MSRKIINTEGPGMVAADARKWGGIAIGVVLLVLVMFWILAHATH